MAFLMQEKNKSMIVTVLGSGTSQGVPVIGCTCPVCRSADPRDKRLRTSILIQTDEVTVAVDAGPDFRQQMLRENVTKLDAVIISHEHKDHIGGLDDLRPYIFKQEGVTLPLGDAPALNLFFDFGGNAAGSSVSISKIYFEKVQ